MKKLEDLIDKPISGEWGKDGDGVKVLRTTNFTNEAKLKLSSVVSRNIDQVKIDKKKLRKGDIIIEKSGGSPKQPVGRVVYFDEEGVFLCNNFTSVLRPKLNKVFPKYLLYQLFSNHKFGYTNAFQNKTTGIINLQLTRYVKSLKIPLPPLAEQKRIANILDQADQLRQLNQQILAEYDALTKSLFLDMFGDPVLNPMGWEEITIENACEKIYGGGTPSKSHPEYYDGIIPWVTPKDMKFEYIKDSIIHINTLGIENSSAKLIPKGSVLMVIRSGILKHTLPVAINTKDVAVNQDMKAYIPKESITNSIFLKSFFQGVSRYLLGKVRAVTADNIEFRQIKELRFPIPPIALQNQFAEKIKNIEAQKASAKTALAASEDLFNSLLQKAFKGDL